MTAPSVHDSERALLGSILTGHEHSESMLSELLEADFGHPVHQRIFQAVTSLLNENLTLNRVSVKERSGVTASDLDTVYQAGVGVTAAEAVTLLKEVKRVSSLRSIYNTCQETVARLGKNVQVEEALSTLERGMYQLDRSGGSEARDGADVLQEVVNGFLDRFRNGGGVTLSTGLRELDKAIIGLREGKMFVLAGRPGMGKTSLADSVRRAVIAQGVGALQFSLEMGSEEILERELAYRSQVNLRKIMAAKDVTEDELERIQSSLDGLKTGLWSIDDKTFSISAMRRRARIQAARLARNGTRLGIVVLDYIQLAGDNGEHREQSVAAVSRGCKLMAKELKCTVMALSQLNRSCESRDDKRPLMSDLRESGSIEQDADIVAFVYRDVVYNREATDDEAELIIRKHRAGPLGTVRLRFNDKLTAFEDLPCFHERDD